MKRLILVFSAMLVSYCIHAQEDNKSKYLLVNSKAKLSTFYAEIAPSTSFSKLNNQKATVIDISGGLILSNRFTVSFFFTGSPKINKLPIPEYDSDEYWDWVDAGVKLWTVSENSEFLYVKLRHAGLRLGYEHYKGNPIFWRTNLGVGFIGGIDLTEDKTFLGLFDNPVYKKSILTLEPSVGVGINMLKWWRVNVDLGYRIVGVDARIIDEADADSFTFKLSFGFGNFSLK